MESKDFKVIVFFMWFISVLPLYWYMAATNFTQSIPENYQILSILKIAVIIWFLLPGKLKNLCQQINLKHLCTPRCCSIIIKHSRNAIFWKDFQPALTEFVLHVQFINAIVLYSSLREIILSERFKKGLISCNLSLLGHFFSLALTLRSLKDLITSNWFVLNIWHIVSYR